MKTSELRQIIREEIKEIMMGGFDKYDDDSGKMGFDKYDDVKLPKKSPIQTPWASIKKELKAMSEEEFIKFVQKQYKKDKETIPFPKYLANWKEMLKRK